MTAPACPLCEAVGGLPVVAWSLGRVIRAQEPGFPAFYRVVLNDHVAEWTDLAPADRRACMGVVEVVEQVLRDLVQPTKINLASLGNVVPHLHWHVVARFDWDSHFPAPLWAAALRPMATAQLAQLEQLLPAVDERIRQHLS